MSVIVKIILVAGAVFLILCSICVIIVALFPPKEWKGGGKTHFDKLSPEEQRKYQEEMYKRQSYSNS